MKYLIIENVIVKRKINTYTYLTKKKMEGTMAIPAHKYISPPLQHMLVSVDINEDLNLISLSLEELIYMYWLIFEPKSILNCQLSSLIFRLSANINMHVDTVIAHTL